MFRCPTCGTSLSRVHRTRFERLLYTDVYRCACGRKRRRASRLALDLSFYRTRHTRCIRCGTFDVRRSTTLDTVDRVSRHPVSVMQRLMGAPVNRCFDCRLQYFDCRPVRKSAEVMPQRHDSSHGPDESAGSSL